MRMGLSSGSSSFDPQCVVHYDSRRHHGPGDLTLVNYGTGGVAFDLEVVEYSPGDYWGIKRYNWYSQGTTGNGIYPTSWDDFGGDPGVAPWFFATHVSPKFIGGDDQYIENEWYINLDVDGDVQIVCGGYLDYFDGPGAPSGFFELSFDNYRFYDEFQPSDFGPFNANRRSYYNDCLVAHYIDPSTNFHKFWIFDGISLYSFSHQFFSNDAIDEDATYGWLFMSDQVSPPTSGGTVKHMFWSFSYHEENQYGPLPGYGEPWGQCTGALMSRPTVEQQADLDTYVMNWWSYFASDISTVSLLNPDL